MREGKLRCHLMDILRPSGSVFLQGCVEKPSEAVTRPSGTRVVSHKGGPRWAQIQGRGAHALNICTLYILVLQMRNLRPQKGN